MPITSRRPTFFIIIRVEQTGSPTRAASRQSLYSNRIIISVGEKELPRLMQQNAVLTKQRRFTKTCFVQIFIMLTNMKSPRLLYEGCCQTVDKVISWKASAPGEKASLSCLERNYIASLKSMAHLESNLFVVCIAVLLARTSCSQGSIYVNASDKIITCWCREDIASRQRTLGNAQTERSAFYNKITKSSAAAASVTDTSTDKTQQSLAQGCGRLHETTVTGHQVSLVYTLLRISQLASIIYYQLHLV